MMLLNFLMIMMILKWEKTMRKEGLDNKTQPRKHWATSRHFDQLKKKM